MLKIASNLVAQDPLALRNFGVQQKVDELVGHIARVDPAGESPDQELSSVLRTLGHHATSFATSLRSLQQSQPEQPPEVEMGVMGAKGDVGDAQQPDEPLAEGGSVGGASQEQGSESQEPSQYCRMDESQPQDEDYDQPPSLVKSRGG